MRSDRVICLLGMLAGVALVPARADQPYAGIGTTPSAADMARWDIDVRGDGRGLPPGSGSVASGSDIYAAHCAACHGDKGQGGLAPALVGGKGTLATAHPVTTVGSYWPYAPTLFDYIRRAMPFDAPESLTNDQVYAVAAYVLWLNGIVPRQTVLDADSLPKVVMPNRNGFTSPDPRPDVR